MANNNPPPARPPPDVVADDFLEQLLSMSAYGGGAPPTLTQHHLISSGGGGSAAVAGGLPAAVFPLALRVEDERRAGAAARLEGAPAANLTNGDPIQLSSLIPALGNMQPNPSSCTYVEHGQTIQSTFTAIPHMQAARPKVRARRGQATDPHSIAERLRRERIAERFKALQELLPNTNKTDRAAMLDEILDYVKFLRLQVKILSMSRLGGAGTTAHLLADIPLLSLESKSTDGVKHQFWEKWTNDGTEHQVAKLMEEDIGAAMQFLQSKALCVMPISVATAMYSPHDKPKDFNPELDRHAPS